MEVIGRGEVPALVREAADGLVLVDSMLPGGVDDRRLVAAVRDAVVLLAPYRQATQSGSVLLAVTLGVPVVAYRAGAVAEHVPDSHLAPVGDVGGLRQVLLGVLRRPGDEASVDVDAWGDHVARAWDGVLSGAR